MHFKQLKYMQRLLKFELGTTVRPLTSEQTGVIVQRNAQPHLGGDVYPPPWESLI